MKLKQLATTASLELAWRRFEQRLVSLRVESGGQVIQSGRLGARANAPLGVVVAVAGFACSLKDGEVNASIAGATG